MTHTFLGSKGEGAEYLKSMLCRIVDAHKNVRVTQATHPTSAGPPVLDENDLLGRELEKLLGRLSEDIPFYDARYMAQMIRDPSLAAIAGYVVFLLSNSNNHAYEGGPITTDLECQVERLLLDALGFYRGWGHLTGGGTASNLEALWIARERSDGQGGILFSTASHFAWQRLASVVRVPSTEIPVDADFRMNLAQVEVTLAAKPIFMVVANLGSTGTGSVDDIAALLKLRDKYGFHLHIDAAYGGFYRALLRTRDGATVEHSASEAANAYVWYQLQLVEEADSVTVDPHKHGLVPYGAGSVFYRNEALRQTILHSAPYTYNVTAKPNIGMYCLEGSRPGAAAAACYLAYQVFPLDREGIGQILEGCLRSAQTLAQLISKSDNYRLVTAPDLDIVCFYKHCPQDWSIPRFNAENLRICAKFSVEDTKNEFFISKFAISADLADKVLGPRSNPDNEDAIVMRCVFMKDDVSRDHYADLRTFAQKLEEVVHAR